MENLLSALGCHVGCVKKKSNIQIRCCVCVVLPSLRTLFIQTKFGTKLQRRKHGTFFIHQLTVVVTTGSRASYEQEPEETLLATKFTQAATSKQNTRFTTDKLSFTYIEILS